jgi:hypothetical protein
MGAVEASVRRAIAGVTSTNTDLIGGFPGTDRRFTVIMLSKGNKMQGVG